MRVSFAGGTTDLPPFVPGGGRIVGAALELRVRVIVEPFDRGWIRLEAPAVGRVLERRSSTLVNLDGDFRLMGAVIGRAGLRDGVCMRVETQIVPGAGLGGSGSAAVAALFALRSAMDPSGAVSRNQVARDASFIETETLGNPCGSQDQVFAAFGGIRDLRFDERGCYHRRTLLVPADLLQLFGGGLLLVDTRLRRISGDVFKRARRPRSEQCTRELVAAAGEVVRGFETCSLERVLIGMRRS